jgi:CheY-like chemotaxis protein
VERLPIILCIDDDAASLAIRKLLLEANGYSVLTATDGAMGITMAHELYCDVVVLDFQMPVLNGDEVAKVLKKEYPTLPIILFTGFSEEIPKDLLSKIDACVNKGSGDLLLSIGRVLQKLPSKRPRKSGEARSCGEPSKRWGT